LATADSNGDVKITRVDNEIVSNQQPAVMLVDYENGLKAAHQGPCWAVSWAHPKFENLVATAGYDKTIKIWKEQMQNQWKLIYCFESDCSVNCLQFAPWEYGLHLVAGTASGEIVLLSLDQDS
jgi:WD40 repeat protein